MKKLKSQSGFVYLARHPHHPTWVKIGFTRRSPYHRLKELSGTSVRTSFEFIEGVFVWNAILSEKKIHDFLQEQGISRQKEFFDLDVDVAKDLLDQVAQIDSEHHRIIPQSTVVVSEEQWDEFEASLTSDFDEHQAQQDVRDWNSSDLAADTKRQQALGQRQLEKLSSQGDPQSSILLAEYVMSQGVDEQHWRHANCLFQAAVKQGTPSAALRSAFWKTLWSKESLNDYWAALHPWRELMSQQQYVPPLVSQTFADEQSLWLQDATRAHSFASWSPSCPRPL